MALPGRGLLIWYRRQLFSTGGVTSRMHQGNGIGQELRAFRRQEFDRGSAADGLLRWQYAPDGEYDRSLTSELPSGPTKKHRVAYAKLLSQPQGSRPHRLFWARRYRWQRPISQQRRFAFRVDQHDLQVCVT